MFVQQFAPTENKETPQVRVTVPLWGESDGDRWIPPPLRYSNADNVSIWWRHGEQWPNLLLCMLDLYLHTPNYVMINNDTDFSSEKIKFVLHEYSWFIVAYSDAIWRHSTKPLPELMVTYCYRVPRDSHKRNFTETAQVNNHLTMFDDYSFKITATSPRGQRVNKWWCLLPSYLTANQSNPDGSPWLVVDVMGHPWPTGMDITIHYNHVMSAMPSQITSLKIVYSTFYSGADQRKHQSSASLAFVQGIHRSPVNSPHKWPVTRKMFPFDDVIMDSKYPRVDID